MSCAEVFSFALILKGSDRTVQILELLEESKREEVKTALESLKSIPPEAIRRLWSERRTGEHLPRAGA
jgi:flagellar motor switch protein FliG